MVFWLLAMEPIKVRTTGWSRTPGGLGGEWKVISWCHETGTTSVESLHSLATLLFDPGMRTWFTKTKESSNWLCFGVEKIIMARWGEKVEILHTHYLFCESRPSFFLYTENIRRIFLIVWKNCFKKFAIKCHVVSILTCCLDLNSEILISRLSKSKTCIMLPLRRRIIE